MMEFMENRVVKFTVVVEYSDWLNGDTGEWLPPTLDKLAEDTRNLVGFFGDDCVSVTVNDELVFERFN